MARLDTLHCTCLASIRDLVPTLPALNHDFTSLSQPTAWQLSSPCCSSLCIPTARPAVPPSPQAILAPESELSSTCPWPHTDTRLISDAACRRICPLPVLHLRHRLPVDRYSLIECWVRLTACAPLLPLLRTRRSTALFLSPTTPQPSSGALRCASKAASALCRP